MALEKCLIWENDEGWIEGIGGRKGKEVIELYFNFLFKFSLGILGKTLM